MNQTLSDARDFDDEANYVAQDDDEDFSTYFSRRRTRGKYLQKFISEFVFESMLTMFILREDR